jgi:hypothetical protein
MSAYARDYSVLDPTRLSIYNKKTHRAVICGAAPRQVLDRIWLDWARYGLASIVYRALLPSISTTSGLQPLQRRFDADRHASSGYTASSEHVLPL